MDRLKAMETFVRVVRDGSFAAAAAKLGLSRAIVTKHVMQLEKQLGVRLINRTTRRSSVTDIGQGYFDFCVRVLAEMAEQDALVTRLQEEPRGELKLLAPKSFGSLHLGNVAAEFMALYPEIRVSLMLSDVSLHAFDLVEHGFDLAIRLHSPSDSSLVARRIGSFHWLPCASPAYLTAHGAPATLDDLARHKCLLHSRHADGVWHFERESGEFPVKVHRRHDDQQRHGAAPGHAQRPGHRAAADLLHRPRSRARRAASRPAGLYRAAGGDLRHVPPSPSGDDEGPAVHRFPGGAHQRLAMGRGGRRRGGRRRAAGRAAAGGSPAERRRGFRRAARAAPERPRRQAADAGPAAARHLSPRDSAGWTNPPPRGKTRVGRSS